MVAVNHLRRFIARHQTPVESHPYVHSRLDELEAAERWRKSNEEARLAGCRCGKPATKVQRFGGTVGGVPHEAWTCEEHEGVQSWSQRNGGPWEPTESFWAGPIDGDMVEYDARGYPVSGDGPRYAEEWLR